MHIVSKSMLLMLVSSSVLTNTFAGIEKWKIKGEKIKCESGECYQVKKGCFKSWEPLTNEITNFEIQEGHHYKLSVSIHDNNKVDVIKVLNDIYIYNKGYKSQTVSNVVWNKNLFIKKVNGKTISSKSAFLKFNNKEHQLSGNGGCNGLGGNIQINGNTITFNDIMMTMMACLEDGISETENKIVQAINNQKLYISNIDNKVFLKNNSGNIVLEMFYYTDNEIKEILGTGTWKLSFLYGEGKDYKDIALTFDFKNNVVNGNTGCNGISSQFTYSNGTIQFQDGVTTMRACLDDEIQKNEKNFINLIHNKKYSIEIIGDRLTFMENGRSAAIFYK
jgi:heat shock protein HslJ